VRVGSNPSLDVPYFQRAGIVVDERVVVPFPEAARRLDAALAAALAPRGLTRSALRRFLDEGRVLLDGRAARASQAVRAGQEAVLLLPPPPPDPERPAPADLPLTLLFEDAHCLAVAKPAGMVTHPARGHWEGTLVNALLGMGRPLSGGFTRGRPGILHRLDKETSGIVLVAKSDVAQAFLARQFAARTVRKVYVALVWGQLEGPASVDAPVGRDPRNRLRMAVVPSGRPARTEFAVLERVPRACLVEARPLTGRTHQIRVHLAHLHHPVVGDTLYAGHPERGLPSAVLRAHLAALGRFLLHARSLEFDSPSGERVTVQCPPPAEFAAALEAFSHHG